MLLRSLVWLSFACLLKYSLVYLLHRHFGLPYVYFIVDLLEIFNDLCRSTCLVRRAEKLISRWVDGACSLRSLEVARHWIHACILLGASSATARVEIDERLSVRALRMLVLHVCIKGRVRQICLLAEGALMITPLNVVLRATLLFWLDRPLAIGGLSRR